ncbi:hypothetical protein [Bradyrhizobium diversitatis]|uniref:Uncharacterized protein n=1 Tax=Bradyrhizobium diversitatis TaxID=2755406 RepID=A0ABS0NUN5_9BRAD|nr:hypothetical protein [Bradyrhizobium diversitatis]MBH5384723.1 hypothetical protein [Bradyrhizobium diversitatis]
MMRPVTAEKWMVIGIRIAIAPSTPRPGNTPVAVPTNAPSNAAPMLTGCKATANPPTI